MGGQFRRPSFLARYTDGFNISNSWISPANIREHIKMKCFRKRTTGSTRHTSDSDYRSMPDLPGGCVSACAALVCAVVQPVIGSRLIYGRVCILDTTGIAALRRSSVGFLHWAKKVRKFEIVAFAIVPVCQKKSCVSRTQTCLHIRLTAMTGAITAHTTATHAIDISQRSTSSYGRRDHSCRRASRFLLLEALT